MARRAQWQRETWVVDRIDHPIVPLLYATDEDGALVCVSLGAHARPMLRHARRHDAHLRVARARGSKVAEQLGEYLSGQRKLFDLPLRMLGTSFQRTAWQTLLSVPHGRTASYGELAEAMGHPGAARAVGRANGQNPIPLVVPCHRIIGHDGRLTGFGGGLPIKRWLLELESPQTTLPWLPGTTDARA